MVKIEISNQEKSFLIIGRVIKDIKTRKCLNQVWDNISQERKQEIFNTWASIAENAITLSTGGNK